MIFQTSLDMEGAPEPNFCSVCDQFEDIVVFFLSNRIETTMCHKCIEHAFEFVVELRKREMDSRA